MDELLHHLGGESASRINGAGDFLRKLWVLLCHHPGLGIIEEVYDVILAQV